MTHRLPRRLVAVAASPRSLLGAAACSDDDGRRRRRPPRPRRRSAELSRRRPPSTAATTYADLVLRGLRRRRRPTAEALQTAVDAFVADPDRGHPRGGQAGLARRPRRCTAPPRSSASTTARSTTPRTGPRARSTPGRSTRPTSTTSRATPTAGIINDAAGVPGDHHRRARGGQRGGRRDEHLHRLARHRVPALGPGPQRRRPRRPPAHRLHHRRRTPSAAAPTSRCSRDLLVDDLTGGARPVGPRGRRLPRDVPRRPAPGRRRHPARHGRPVAGRAGRRAHRRGLRDQGPGGRALLLLRQHHRRHRRQRHRHPDGVHRRLPRHRRHLAVRRRGRGRARARRRAARRSSTPTWPRPRPSRRRSTS